MWFPWAARLCLEVLSQPPFILHVGDEVQGIVGVIQGNWEHDDNSLLEDSILPNVLPHPNFQGLCDCPDHSVAKIEN